MMQPLTLPEQRLIETILRSGMSDLNPNEVEVIKKALKMALETNEALKEAWRQGTGPIHTAIPLGSLVDFRNAKTPSSGS